ncbi:MAG: polysaccharide deacetylase [Candidatus Omnitrophica bacterium CG12_big_fil_rev_8_21_14_0_65_42_8]|nr:MAG: polysaccharide deacetylase [Candidatus Omnitrophica bacterium CG12_big_fil_rev_8_21_14_0_65_42_8]
MRFRAAKKNIIIAIVLIAALAVILYAKAQYVVPIVMYHKIDGNSAVSRLSVSPESFKAQMVFLKRHRYNVVRLKDLSEMVRENKLPSKTIAVTFDDGYEDNYVNAYPVLKGLGLPATIFIIPAMIGNDGYLTWDQVVEMSESGIITIGSHSLSHSWLPSLAVQELDREIIDSKRSIESHIGKDVDTFSYPLGAFNENAREKVIKAGYKIAVATNPGKKYPKHDLFAMKRLRISSTSDNLFVFWFEITGFYTWIKEHRDKD